MPIIKSAGVLHFGSELRGDVVRFADRDLHGFRNASDVPFVYLSVTAPPVNFREAYSKDWSKSDRRSY